MLANFRTFKISVDFYKECQKIKLPKYLKDQLNRNTSSISLNLSEGYGKSTYQDQRRYFHIAMGSLREAQAVLILSNLESSKAFHISDYLGACLYKLIHSGSPH